MPFEAHGECNAADFHPCGVDAFGAYCHCDDFQVLIPQNDFVQAVQACIGELPNDDPPVSVLDVEMRGLWGPRIRVATKKLIIFKL